MKLRNKNTGVIGYIEHNLLTTETLTGETLLTVRYKDDSGVTCYSDYATIKFFNEQWEDYKPTEPLIKDKEVRTMIRLWAKIHNADTLRYLELNGIVGNYLEAGRYSVDINIENLRVGKYYTIKELCGEEKE